MGETAKEHKIGAVPIIFNFVLFSCKSSMTLDDYEVLMDSEKVVISVLETMGIEAKKIPESNDESPDFIASYGSTKCLIELKTKLDDLDKERERDQTISSGRVYDESNDISYQNTIAKRVRKASKQLNSLAQDVDFKLVFLLALGNKPDVQLKQFEMTLYGKVNLFDLDGNSNQMKSCFYFGESSFFRYRDRLDGAIVSTLEKGRLCINNHSPKYQAFKESELLKAFGEGVIDPVELEKKGAAYIVDGNVNRSDKAEVLSFVQKKYGKPRLIDLNFTHYSASVAVPRD